MKKWVSFRSAAFLGGSGGLPLDLYSGNTPIGAWALRRLWTSHTGPLVQVRETGGDTLLDIGYGGDNSLDVAALEAHIGSADGEVTKWYDQSGNGRHWVVDTGAWCPLVAASGVVKTLNGRPTLHFPAAEDSDDNNGVRMLMDGAAPTVPSYGSASLLAVIHGYQAYSSPAAHTGLWNFSTIDDDDIWYGSNKYLSALSHTLRYVSWNNDPRVVTVWSASNDWKLYTNGSLQQTDSTNSVTTSASWRLGCGDDPRLAYTHYFYGDIPELIIWPEGFAGYPSLGLLTDTRDYFGIT